MNIFPKSSVSVNHVLTRFTWCDCRLVGGGPPGGDRVCTAIGVQFGGSSYQIADHGHFLTAVGDIQDTESQQMWMHGREGLALAIMPARD